MGRFHITILSTVWIVAASLLGLQFVLNALKFQELIVDATSQRALVTAENIESAILRAEQVGLSISEVANLNPLIERELTHSTILEDIRVFGPGGDQIAGSNLVPIDPDTLDNLLRRIRSRDEAVFSQEQGGHLFTALTVYDSSSSAMGVILLSVDRATYATTVGSATRMLGWGFLVLFGVIALLVVPFVLLGFRRVGQLIGVIETQLSTDAKADTPPDADAEINELRALIDQGNEAYESVVAELDRAERAQGSTH